MFSPDIVLDGAKLEYVENAKYLGVILNEKCQDDNDIQRHIRSLYARANTVIREFYNCTVDIKLSLFKSYCLPSYCSHLWVRYNKYSYSKVRIAFNNVYRRLLGFRKCDSTSQMYVSHNIDNVDAFMQHNVHGFMQRVCKISIRL